ncbi:MAG: glycosyltransferase, partial [Gaiellaceae bacterium]
LDPEAQLVLCAAAPDTAEIEREVRARVEASNGVCWINELLPRAEVVQILSNASVFVCPSIYEPFGLVNLEAMACEAPVVATAVGGIPEIVVDGETGYLVSPDGDLAHELAERINALLASDALRRRFGKAGRARVLDRFSWPVLAQRTADLYERLESGE